MKFKIKNNILIKNLQKINRLLSKNTSFPILENVLMNVNNETLSLTTSNLEIELICHIKLLKKYTLGNITVSGRKLLDICRNSPETSDIKIELKINKIYINVENSRYVLNTLPADNFPNHRHFNHISEFFISSYTLKKMIEKTAFSMGKQDVRYYLNGMLLEKKNKFLHGVTTDGYRLSKSSTLLEEKTASFTIIVPRKGIIELYRLLNIHDELIRILIGKNNIRIYIKELILTTQLIEGDYPDYNSVIIMNKKDPIILNCDLLKKSLLRAAILSHEKFCGIEIHISQGQFKVLSDNQEEEIAEDIFQINYFSTTSIEISINVYYILDILNTITSQNILLFINESKSLIQIESEDNSSSVYIVMLLKR